MSENVCRVCLDRSDPNQLLRPCGCSGSVADIHYKCLKNCIEISRELRCSICGQQWTGCVITRQKKSLCQYLREERQLLNFILLLSAMMSAILVYCLTIIPNEMVDWNTMKKVRQTGGWIITLTIVVSFLYLWQIVVQYLSWREFNYKIVLVSCNLKTE